MVKNGSAFISMFSDMLFLLLFWGVWARLWGVWAVFLGFSNFCSLSFRSAFPVFYRQFFLAFCCYVRRFCFLFFLFVVAFFCSKLGPKTDSKSIKIIRKSFQNPPKIGQKSAQNRSKIVPGRGSGTEPKKSPIFSSIFPPLGRVLGGLGGVLGAKTAQVGGQNGTKINKKSLAKFM